MIGSDSIETKIDLSERSLDLPAKFGQARKPAVLVESLMAELDDSQADSQQGRWKISAMATDLDCRAKNYSGYLFDRARLAPVATQASKAISPVAAGLK